MKQSRTVQLSFLFIVVLFIVTIGIIFNISSKNVEQSTTEHLSSIVSFQESAFEKFLASAEFLVADIKQSPSAATLLSDACLGNNSFDLNLLSLEKNSCGRSYLFLQALVENHPEVSEIHLHSHQSGTTVSTSYLHESGEFAEALMRNWDSRSSGATTDVSLFPSTLIEGVYLSDIFLDTQGDGEPSIFVITDIYSASPQIIGSLVAELSIDELDSLLENPVGMGETGEAFLVGRDRLMRSNARLSSSPTRFVQQVDTLDVRSCFQHQDEGFSSQKNALPTFVNYRGEEVFGAYGYFSKLDACIIAEVGLDEVSATRSAALKIILLMSAIFFSGLIFFMGQINRRTRSLRESQKRLEETLIDKEKFEQAVNAASDGISIIDHDFRVLYVNKSIVASTGFDQESSVGKYIHTLWWSRVSKSMLSEIQETVFDSKHSGTWEIVTRSTVVPDFDSELVITPVTNALGEVLFALVIEHDLTERKKVEQLKDDFVSIASHELRTPMTVVRGYLALLLDQSFGEISEKQRSVLSRIDSSTVRLIELVTDMLDMTKLEQYGEHNIERTSFDLGDLIQDVVTDYQPVLDEKGVTGRVDVEATAHPIFSDQKLLRRAIVNLLSNAVKFTKPGGSVTVRLLRGSDEQRVRVEVVDTGIGIPSQMRTNLFEKFTQAKDYLKRDQEGTGLGLPITKKIVELLGGTISFTSVEGEGSTFFFDIPTS